MTNKKRRSQRAPPYNAFMDGNDFRRLALALPRAIESSHHDAPDFRVNGRIFATLAKEREGCGVLILTPEQQAGMVADEPAMFSPVPGGWGRMGCTLLRLDATPPDIAAAALKLAWQRRATPAKSKAIPRSAAGANRRRQ